MFRELENFKKKHGLSSFSLKTIAMVTMFLDHYALMIILNGKLYGYNKTLLSSALALPEGQSLYFWYKFLRVIGRISFPIFALLIVEGFRKTKNRFLYFLRIILLGIISEVPYDLMVFNKYICFDVQNVIFTYMIGLFLLLLLEKTRNLPIYIHLIFAVIASIIAYLIRSDYNIYGILLIFVFYEFRHDINFMLLLSIPILFISSFPGFYGMAILSLPFLYLYNGQEGIKLGRIPYIFYPVHMLFFYIIVYLSYIK